MSLRQETNAILKQHGITLSKTLGQHFLVEQHIYDIIVNAANLNQESKVLEIGAGLGHLTKMLAEKTKSVISVEIDPRCQKILEERLSHFPGLNIIAGDIRKLSLSKLCSPPPWIVVANLPYYLSSLLLRRFLDEKELFSHLVLMLQEEVAERLVAKPGTKAYGLLSVLTQAFTTPEIITKVPSSAFLPPPKIDSAIIRIRTVPFPLPGAAVRTFTKLVKASFAQRRKTLRNNLKGVMGLSLPQWEKLALHAGIDLGRRGETLSVSEFIALTKEIIQQN